MSIELLKLLASGKTNSELVELRKGFQLQYREAARTNDKFALEHARNSMTAILEILASREEVKF